MKKMVAVIAILLLLPPAVAMGKAEEDPGFGNFEAPLPGINQGQSIDQFVKQGNNPLTRYAAIAIDFITGGIVVGGLISVVIGGYIYMTAGGSADRISTAKSFISAALIGIILALTAYLILNTISPQFASQLQDPQFTP